MTAKLVAELAPLAPRFRGSSLGSGLLALVAVLGCQTPSRPTVRSVTEVAAEAVSKNDARGLSTVVVRDDGSPCSEEELKELLRRSGPELVLRLRQAVGASERYQTMFEYTFADGVSLTVQERLRSVLIHSVSHAEACPTSVVGALRLLSVHVKELSQRANGLYVGPTYLSRNAYEQWSLDVKSWTSGLAVPDELDVEEVGRTAIVNLPTGRVVELSFEEGCWRIERLQ